jgi:hypothetical protein
VYVYAYVCVYHMCVIGACVNVLVCIYVHVCSLGVYYAFMGFVRAWWCVCVCVVRGCDVEGGVRLGSSHAYMPKSGSPGF